MSNLYMSNLYMANKIASRIERTKETDDNIDVYK
jgi:hypothetical protein